MTDDWVLLTERKAGAPRWSARVPVAIGIARGRRRRVALDILDRMGLAVRSVTEFGHPEGDRNG